MLLQQGRILLNFSFLMLKLLILGINVFTLIKGQDGGLINRL